MKFKLSNVLGKAQQALTQYPLLLFCSFVMTCTAIYLVESSSNNAIENHIAFRVLIVSSLGIPISFAMKMLSQRNSKLKFLELLVIPFLVGYYFILPANEDDFTEKYAFLLIPSYLLAHLLVAFVPYLKKRNTETDFWEYNKKLFVNFFLTVVFTAVLCGGIEVAISAIDHLFNMNFDSTLYIDTFLFFLIFGSTFIFSLFNIEGLKELEQKVEYPVVLRFFTQFILVPLLIIYWTILLFYSFKILFTWELPRGWVSYLVLVYSVLGILALLLVHPLKEQTEKSWIRLFGRIFYYTLIPLLVLLFVSIFTRLLEYGFTEARYFVLLLAVWLSVVFLYFVFYRKSSIKFIPISLFAFGLFALVCPFLNTFSVAKNSQKRDLMRVLVENNLLKEGKIDFDQEVTSTVVKELEDKFSFLDKRGEREYLEQFLGEGQLKKTPTKVSRNWNFKSSFTQFIREDSTPHSVYLNQSNTKSVYEVENFDYVVRWKGYYRANPNFTIGEDVFELKEDSNLFQVVLNNKKSFDLLPEIKRIFKENVGLQEYAVDSDDLSIEFELEPYRIKMVFESISRSGATLEEASYNAHISFILIQKNH